MKTFYMSFVVDGKFAGACLVHANYLAEAMVIAWDRGCNPGGEIASIEPEFIPDQKWFYRLLSRSDLAEMETELNEKYHQDNPRITPNLRN